MFSYCPGKVLSKQKNDLRYFELRSNILIFNDYIDLIRIHLKRDLTHGSS